MVIFILLVSVFVAWSSWKRHRTISKAAQPIQKKLWEQTCVVSASLAIVLAFYSLLLAILAFGWQWITITISNEWKQLWAALEHGLVNTSRVGVLGCCGLLSCI